MRNVQVKVEILSIEDVIQQKTPRLVSPLICVAMRSKVFFGSNILQLLLLSPVTHLCVALMCQCSGLSFPRIYFFASYSSGFFSKLRRHRPRYPDPISKPRELDVSEREATVGDGGQLRSKTNPNIRGLFRISLSYMYSRTTGNSGNTLHR